MITIIKKSLLTILLGVTYLAQAQLSTDYPFLRKVSLKSQVKYESSNQMYYYDYTLVNDISSKGVITSFWLDISRGKNSVSLDTTGLLFADNEYIEWSFRENFPRKKEEIIPVGYYKLPEKSDATLGNPPTACFDIDTLEVKPGQSLKGFVMMSRGLPTIRWFISFPYFNIYEFFPNIEDTTSNMSIEQMDSIREAVNYHGLTIGPTAPPINFIATVWCDTLTSYTIQSRTLGWIKDQATANKYLGYFTSAKTSLGQNNTTSARTTLQQVIRDVNIDSTSNLTSEAYALIRYNTEYLISQLPASPSEPAYVFQVDTLIAVLQRMSNSNWIGDIAFVNSLTKQLTIVRTNLEKGKVPQAGTQLQTFLNRIQKVYNNTLTKLQNGKPLPKSFLTQEGYALLSSKTTGLLTQLGSLGVSISVPGQFTTIQAAVNASKPGTTIMIDVGTYNEVVNITNKDSLTLLASGGVTIQGVHIAKSQVIDIKGFIIDAANAGKDAVQIEGQENSDITIEANEIKNSSKDGIAMGKNNVNTRVLNNVIVNNQQNGIDFADGTSGVQYIVNNTIVRNGYNGIDAASQQELYLVNNIISFNGTGAGTSGGRYGIKRDAQGLAASITLLNNLIIDNNGTTNKKSSKDLCNTQQILNSADASNITTAGTEGSGVSSSSGAQLSDILLPDYRLTQTSIAIDKGTTNFDQLPEEDKDGNPRIRKTTIDIGAYEAE
ncbi:MAG: right-handed parallel beta-helix repeat-containing protein [Bacteroidota bacterium]